MTATWWNTSYPFRRNISIEASSGLTIPENHPIFITYLKSNLIDLGKVRPDFEDIEVLHNSGSDATPYWTVVGRDIIETEDEVTIVFNVLSSLSDVDFDYYIYMGNDFLSNQPTRPIYEDYRFLLSTYPDSGLGLSFVRPGEDWLHGESAKINAKGTFSFYGPSVRLKVEKSSDSGILEIKFDNEDPILLDLYSVNINDVVVFERAELLRQKHNLRFRVTGNKNPAATDIKVHIKSFEYSTYIDALDLGEEIYSTTGSFTVITGV